MTTTHSPFTVVTVKARLHGPKWPILAVRVFLLPNPDLAQGQRWTVLPKRRDRGRRLTFAGRPAPRRVRRAGGHPPPCVLQPHRPATITCAAGHQRVCARACWWACKHRDATVKIHGHARPRPPCSCTISRLSRPPCLTRAGARSPRAHGPREPSLTRGLSPRTFHAHHQPSPRRF